MKRRYYIGILALSLVFVSCEKEVIRPTVEVPAPCCMQYRTGSTLDSGVSADSEDETADGDITDPNSDKDESARRKR